MEAALSQSLAGVLCTPRLLERQAGSLLLQVTTMGLGPEVHPPHCLKQVTHDSSEMCFKPIRSPWGLAASGLGLAAHLVS